MTASIPTINLSSAVTVKPSTLMDDTDRAFADTFRMVVERIKRVRRQSMCRIATSFGKDSTALLNAALQAHIELVQAQEIPADSPFICTNIDTGVDDVYVRGQIKREVADLKAYCTEQGVNLQFLTAKPPARYSWAVMYCSGMKLPSFVKSSADCSVILKIDPAKRLERDLMAETGDSMVTLLGSRSVESARRAASIKKHSNTVAEIEVHGGENGTPRTCAPMFDLTDGDVFGMLRRMGSNPIIKTKAHIPSYATHHKLIIKLYGDAQETCPVTSFADAVVPKTGSCGSSRFGCTLCLKVPTDKSATARSINPQYAAASNVLAIRDWLAHHAEDMSLREPLAKSVCPVTQTLVVQENTYNAQTLEKLVYWLCQATRDDKIRAEKFRALLSSGDLMQDSGYADIMNDAELSAEDKQFFGDHYIETHKSHMVQLIDLEQVLMICAIHARDGVKLPPYHALWIYIEVENGRYIPYPTIDGPMTQDPVPEPKFVQCSLPATVKMHLGEVLLDTEMACGDAQRGFVTQQVRVGEMLSLDSLKRPVKHSFSKRKIVKKRRKSGKVTEIVRGRMLTQLAGASIQPSLKASHIRPIMFQQPQEHATEHDAINMLGLAASADKTPGGMSINTGESLYWFIEMEFDRAMQKHDTFVQNHGRYAFGGIKPLQHMLSFGVLCLTPKAMRSTDLLLMRTDMLFQSGLLSLSADELKSSALSQSEYRKLRAKKLMAIREARNAERKSVKAQLELLRSRPDAFIHGPVANTVKNLKNTIEQLVTDAVILKGLIDTQGDFRFDGALMSQKLECCLANINTLDNAFGGAAEILKRIGLYKASTATRMAAAAIATDYQSIKREALYDAFGRIEFTRNNPQQARSLPEVLCVNTTYSARDVNLAVCKDMLRISNLTQFQEAYRKKGSNKVAQMSFLKHAAA